MVKKIAKSKIIPIIVVMVTILTSLVLSFNVVNARSGFAKKNNSWYNVDSRIYISEDDYPFNNTVPPQAGYVPGHAYVNSLAMNFVYGSSRKLVSYYGELPYAQTHKADGSALEGWSGYYTEDKTTMTADTNPDYKGGYGVPAKDYWGVDSSDIGNAVTNDKFINKATAEKINDTDVKSLRLYALSRAGGGFWTNLLYTILNGFAGICTALVSLIVKAKNLDMNFILETLHLARRDASDRSDLTDILTKSFIYDPDQNGVGIQFSPLLGICIAILIFAIVAYVIRYVKGAEKTQGLLSIIGNLLIGSVIIGICLTGRLGDLGQTFSNLATKMLDVTVSTINGGSGQAFLTDINDTEHQNQVTQLKELGMIYKPYIDIQLCTQFNVKDIDELDFAKFGDPGGGTAKSMLVGVNSYTGNMSDFDNNLGYYFWFADSSAVNKTTNNNAVPSTNAAAAEKKLNSMITYLQNRYNTGNNQTQIKNIVDSFADPHSFAGAGTMFLFAIVMIILGIVLLKYAINVLIAKLEVFVALLGLPIAGPLILSSKKKLVDTGKCILGMLVVAFIEVTIWSIFFDLIIYTTAVIIGPTPGRLFVTIAFLLLFLYFNPYIAQKIKSFMDTSTRALSPAFHQARNTLKQRVRQVARDKAREYGDSEKVVGYDKDGNAITEKRKGNLAHKMMMATANSLEDPNQRKRLWKINSEGNKEHDAQVARSTAELRKDAERRVDDVETAIAADAQNKKNTIDANARAIREKCAEYDENGNLIGYNMNNLTDEEKAMVNDLQLLEDEESALIGDARYKELLDRKRYIEEHNKNLGPDETPMSMNEDELEELKQHQDKLAKVREELNQKRVDLSEELTRRSKIDAAKEAGIIISDDTEDVDAKISEDVEYLAQQEHLDEYKDALEHAIDAHAEDVDNPAHQGGSSKLGSPRGLSGSKVNRAAVEQQAAAELRLHQLMNGKKVSSKRDAEAAVKGIGEVVDHEQQSLVGKAATNIKGKAKGQSEALKEDAARRKLARKVARTESGKVLPGVATSALVSSIVAHDLDTRTVAQIKNDQFNEDLARVKNERQLKAQAEEELIAKANGRVANGEETVETGENNGEDVAAAATAIVASAEAENAAKAKIKPVAEDDSVMSDELAEEFSVKPETANQSAVAVESAPAPVSSADPNDVANPESTPVSATTKITNNEPVVVNGDTDNDDVTISDPANQDAPQVAQTGKPSVAVAPVTAAPASGKLGNDVSVEDQNAPVVKATPADQTGTPVAGTPVVGAPVASAASATGIPGTKIQSSDAAAQVAENNQSGKKSGKTTGKKKGAVTGQGQVASKTAAPASKIVTGTATAATAAAIVGATDTQADTAKRPAQAQQNIGQPAPQVDPKTAPKPVVQTDPNTAPQSATKLSAQAASQQAPQPISQGAVDNVGNADTAPAPSVATSAQDVRQHVSAQTDVATAPKIDTNVSANPDSAVSAQDVQQPYVAPQTAAVKQPATVTANGTETAARASDIISRQEDNTRKAKPVVTSNDTVGDAAPTQEIVAEPVAKPVAQPDVNQSSRAAYNEAVRRSGQADASAADALAHATSVSSKKLNPASVAQDSRPMPKAKVDPQPAANGVTEAVQHDTSNVQQSHKPSGTIHLKSSGQGQGQPSNIGASAAAIAAASAAAPIAESVAVHTPSPTKQGPVVTGNVSGQNGAPTVKQPASHAGNSGAVQPQVEPQPQPQIKPQAKPVVDTQQARPQVASQPAPQPIVEPTNVPNVAADVIAARSAQKPVQPAKTDANSRSADVVYDTHSDVRPAPAVAPAADSRVSTQNATAQYQSEPVVTKPVVADKPNPTSTIVKGTATESQAQPYSSQASASATGKRPQFNLNSRRSSEPQQRPVTQPDASNIAPNPQQPATKPAPAPATQPYVAPVSSGNSSSVVRDAKKPTVQQPSAQSSAASAADKPSAKPAPVGRPQTSDVKKPVVQPNEQSGGLSRDDRASSAAPTSAAQTPPPASAQKPEVKPTSSIPNPTGAASAAEAIIRSKSAQNAPKNGSAPSPNPQPTVKQAPAQPQQKPITNSPQPAPQPAAKPQPAPQVAPQPAPQPASKPEPAPQPATRPAPQPAPQQGRSASAAGQSQRPMTKQENISSAAPQPAAPQPAVAPKQATSNSAPKSNPNPAPIPTPTQQPAAKQAPQPAPQNKPTATQNPASASSTTPQPAVRPEPTPQPVAKSEPAPQPAPQSAPQPAAKPQPAPQPAAKPETVSRTAPNPAPSPKPETKPQSAPQPAVRPEPAPQPATQPQPAPQPTVQPAPAQQQAAKPVQPQTAPQQPAQQAQAAPQIKLTSKRADAQLSKQASAEARATQAREKAAAATAAAQQASAVVEQKRQAKAMAQGAGKRQDAAKEQAVARIFEKQAKADAKKAEKAARKAEKEAAKQAKKAAKAVSRDVRAEVERREQNLDERARAAVADRAKAANDEQARRASDASRDIIAEREQLEATKRAAGLKGRETRSAVSNDDAMENLGRDLEALNDMMSKHGDDED